MLKTIFSLFSVQITLEAKFDSFRLSLLCCFILLITEMVTSGVMGGSLKSALDRGARRDMNFVCGYKR